MNLKEAEKFIKKIAKRQKGCAPSVGLMDEIVEKAREIINKKNSR